MWGLGVNSALNELSNTDALMEYRCTYRIQMHLSKIKTKFKYYPLDQTVTLLNLLYDIWLAILMKKYPFFAVTDILIIFSTIASCECNVM